MSKTRIAIPALLLVCACSLWAQAHPRIVMVVAPKDFTDQEYTDPRAVFDAGGALVRVASTSRGSAVSHNGTTLTVDEAISDITLDQCDALVLVGGMGALTYLMDDEALRTIIVAAVASGKVVAAICVAPAVVARAGVLRNIRATCYPEKSVVSVLRLNGADYVEAPVVSSGKIVTANGPGASKAFAERVLEILQKR